MSDLKSCPFCGHQPTIERWHGGGPQKRMIHCDHDDCEVHPKVTGHTLVKAMVAWNCRTRPRLGTYTREEFEADGSGGQGMSRISTPPRGGNGGG